MTEEKPFSCQFWFAPDQSWVLNIDRSFSTIREAKEYGKGNYKEFRVIGHGVVRYTRLYRDDVLVEGVGDSIYLEEHRGSTLQELLARQEKNRIMNKVGTITVLESVSGELRVVEKVLSQIRYVVRTLGYETLDTDLTRQLFMVGEQIRRIDHLSHKLETSDDVQDSS